LQECFIFIFILLTFGGAFFLTISLNGDSVLWPSWSLSLLFFFLESHGVWGVFKFLDMIEVLCPRCVLGLFLLLYHPTSLILTDITNIEEDKTAVFLSSPRGTPRQVLFQSVHRPASDVHRTPVLTARDCAKSYVASENPSFIISVFNFYSVSQSVKGAPTAIQSYQLGTTTTKGADRSFLPSFLARPPGI